MTTDATARRRTRRGARTPPVGIVRLRATPDDEPLCHCPGAHQGARMSDPFRIGFILFPNIMQLDMTGPLEVLAQLPSAEIHLVWKTRDAVKAGSGLTMLPTTTFAEC